MKLRFLSTVAAVALLSTAAMAQSVLDIRDGVAAAAVTAADAPDLAGTATGAVTVAKEVLTGATAVAEIATLATPRSLIYVPDIDMAQNATFEVTIVNGAIQAAAGNNIYLSEGLATEVGKMTDFVADANGNYTWMRFQITKGAGLVSGASVHFSEAKDGTLDAAGSITVVANQGLAKGAKVTAQVTLAKDDNGNTQNAPLTAVEDLIEVVDGITAAVTAPVTNSVIDVDSGRTNFVAGGATTLTSSQSTTVTITTNAAEVGLVLNGATDTYDLVIERDNCSGLDDVAGSIVVGGGGAPADFNASAGCKWQWTGDFTLGDATGSALTGAGETATITVNGTDVLQTGDWTTTLKIKANEITPATTEVTLLDSETLITWSINGAQFIVPYINTNAAYGTYLVVTNTSDKDGDMSMDVYADKGNKLGETQAAMACQNVSIGTIPANSTATFYPSDLNTAIDATAGCANFSTTNDRYLGQFSVVAPDNSIHATAFQKDGTNGKRSVPVLTTGIHGWKE